MSEENTTNPEKTTQNSEDLSPEKEKELLMNKARIMGVKVSNNIGLDTLRDRIAEAQKEQSNQETGNAYTSDQGDAVNPLIPGSSESGKKDKAGKKKKLSLRQHVHNENMRLIRIRVTCMNPAKADLQGEIFTVANEHLGTVRKFVPFGELTEDGFHVPYCIYKLMKSKQFYQTRTIRDRRTGTERPETTALREFSMEVLPPLNQEELKKLATAQTAAGSFNA